jgi:hypothetical protein
MAPTVHSKAQGKLIHEKKPEVESPFNAERLEVEDQYQEWKKPKNFLIWKTVHTFSHALKKY